jgi:hypothetical protein
MPVYVIAACVLPDCRIFNNILLTIGLLLEWNVMTRGTVTHNPTSLPRLFAPAGCNCRLKNLTDLELGALDILGSRRANFKRAICIRAAAMAAQPLIHHDGLQQTGQRT